MIKMVFAEIKLELPGSNVIEEMKKLELNKMSSKTKADRIMDKLIILPKNHKYNKNKKQWNNFSNKSFLLIMIY